MTISEATASGSITTSSTSDVLMTSMTLTPGAGHYLAVGTCQFTLDTADEYIYISIYVNNVQQAHTERRFYNEGSVDGAVYTYMTHAYVNPGAGEAVELRWSVSNAAATATATNRSIVMLPYDSGAFSQVTATGDDTTSSATYEALDSMSFSGGSQPASGTYLAIFSTSAEADGGNDDIFFGIHVGGVLEGDGERWTHQETSAYNSAQPVGIVAVVSPNGSQDVDVQWHHVGVGDVATCHERTFTLVKVDASDIDSVSATALNTATNTTDAVVNSMTITPGADEWLAMFTCTTGYGIVTGSNNTMYFTPYTNAVAEGNGERSQEWDTSIDNAEFCTGFIAVVVNPGVGQTVDIRWRGNDTDQRSIWDRGLVLVREVSAARQPRNPFYVYQTPAIV